MGPAAVLGDGLRRGRAAPRSTGAILWDDVAVGAGRAPRDCMVGAGARIGAGAQLGPGAVVAANAVVPATRTWRPEPRARRLPRQA